MSRAPVRPGGLRLAARKVVTPLVFGLVPAVAVAVCVGSIHSASFLFDFHGDLYDAGRAILHGRNPYETGFLAHLAAVAAAGGQPATTFAVPVYPAPDLLASAPLALLPFTLAGLGFTAVSIASLVLALRLLAIRDLRCYGAAFLSWPVLHSLRLGQLNLLLVLGLAIAWRYRERVAPSAVAAAITISAKLLLWPVAILLVLQRRYRTAALATLVAVVGTVAAWAVIGFDGLTSYPQMLGDLSRVEGTAGVSVGAFSVALGASRALGDGFGLAITAVLLFAAWRLVRAREPARAFALAVVASLTASPLVWPHYLTLLIVPIALISPSFGPLWLAPLLAWVAPVELTDGRAGEIALYLGIELIVVVAVAAPLLRRVFSMCSRAFMNPLGGGSATVRLGSGLESTSSRSYIAAQRPNKGPEEPHYTQVEDLMPRTANRPT